MPLENYLNQNDIQSGGYAVVDSLTNRLLHTFKTDIVARAFSESVPGSRVIWLSKRMIIDTLKN